MPVPTLRAQVVPPPGSEVPIPPKPKTDSTAPKPDTIKPRFARSTDPHTGDVGPQYSWDRAEMFASGALNLAELLERVPGVTSFRSGWMNSMKFAGVNGDLTAIRIFYDGVELDDLNSRTQPLVDLNTVELWSLERVTVERLGGELRVYVRSWQADRTTPQTRVDVSTGDEDTNIYRGFYGKRFANGGGLQFAGQQFSTTSARFGGGGDALSVLARIGVAKRMWSADAYALRTQTTRITQGTFGTGLAIPPYSATQSLVYARAAIGDVRGGPWLEAIASNRRVAENTPHLDSTRAKGLRVLPDTVDTTVTQQQYVISAGFKRGPVDVIATERMRAFSGQTAHTQSGRAQIDIPYGLLTLSAEHDGFFKRNRTDAVARLSPMPFVAVSGAITRSSSSSDTEVPALGDIAPDFVAARIEGGVKIINPWIIAGFLTRDTALLTPLRAIDTAYVANESGRRHGVYGGVRGTLYKALGADVIFTQWGSAGPYRPKYQSRSELYLTTRWLSRFPSGNFGIHAAGIHEYRSEVAFPTAAGDRVTASSNVFSGVLEIRIMRATISYQIRNMNNELYQLVPDFYMPHVVNLYGVRWEFVN